MKKFVQKQDGPSFFALHILSNKNGTLASFFFPTSEDILNRFELIGGKINHLLKKTRLRKILIE